MVAPASTAARELATAMSPSLWAWMPMAVLLTFLSSRIVSAIKLGRLPPLVSHRASQSAPASEAARTAASA